MKTAFAIALVALLAACGGGDPEDEPQQQQHHDEHQPAPVDCEQQPRPAACL